MANGASETNSLAHRQSTVFSEHQITFPPSSSFSKCVLQSAKISSSGSFFFFLVAPGLIYLFIFIFIYGCVGSSFLCEGFLQLRQVGATHHRGARASHYRGLSCCGAQAPDAQAQ